MAKQDYYEVLGIKRDAKPWPVRDVDPEFEALDDPLADPLP